VADNSKINYNLFDFKNIKNNLFDYKNAIDMLVPNIFQNFFLKKVGKCGKKCQKILILNQD